MGRTASRMPCSSVRPSSRCHIALQRRSLRHGQEPDRAGTTPHNRSRYRWRYRARSSCVCPRGIAPNRPPYRRCKHPHRAARRRRSTQCTESHHTLRSRPRARRTAHRTDRRSPRRCPRNSYPRIGDCQPDSDRSPPRTWRCRDNRRSCSSPERECTRPRRAARRHRRRRRHPHTLRQGSQPARNTLSARYMRYRKGAHQHHTRGPPRRPSLRHRLIPRRPPQSQSPPTPTSLQPLPQGSQPAHPCQRHPIRNARPE